MPKIKLSKHNKYALVDDDIFEQLSKYRWFLDKGGYAVRQVYEKGSGRANRKVSDWKMHRLVTDAPKGTQVDHINGNRLDNRRENLRLCNQSGNSCNSKTRVDNKSGFRGVSWNKQRNKWKVTIQKGNQIYHGGFYIELADAAGASLGLRILLHGEFVKE